MGHVKTIVTIPVEHIRSAGAVVPAVSELIAKAAPATNPPAELQMGLRERTMEIDFERAEEKPDVESRTVRMSIASEDPYLTWIWDQKTDWFGRAYEVLGHKPKEIRAARMKSGGAILVNHDINQHVGVAQKFWIEDGRSYVQARFGKGELAEEVFQDVVDGVRRFTSVRYRVYAYQLEREQKDGYPVYRAIDWEPVEGSIVSVPADPTVGVGRGANTAEPNVVHVVREEESMKKCAKCGHDEERCACAPGGEGARSATGTLPPPEPSGGASQGGGGAARLQIVETPEDVQRRARDAERLRSSEITAVGEQWPQLREAAAAAIRNGTPLDQFRKEAMEALKTDGQVRNVSDTDSDIGLSQRERKQFSFVRFLNALANPADAGAQKAAEFELEAARAAGAKSKRQQTDMSIPAEVLREPLRIPQGMPLPPSWRGYRAPQGINPEQTSVPHLMRAFQAGDPDAGGYTIQTELLAASFIELLAARIVVAPLCTTLTGLVGNVAIPKEIGEAAVSWLAEDGSATETTGQDIFGQVGLTPKTLSSRAGITRRLLLQSAIDIEAWLRMHLAGVRAREIERAIINGSGAANQPLGILNAPNRGSVAFGNAAIAWAKWVELMSDVMDANADMGTLAFLTNPVVYGQGLRVLKAAAAGGEFIFNEGRGRTSLGYPLLLSTKVPKNLGVGTNKSAAIFGNWAELLLGYWSGMDVLVDPYTGSASGQVKVVLFQDMDINYRHQESFSAGVDIDAAA